MPIATDILIDYTNRRIYQDHAYVAGTDTAYSSQALYTYLMGVFDDQAQMDNTIPLSAQTPNAFTMTNGWFIDDETVKWFKGGAVTTESWTHPTNTTGIRLLKLATITGVTSADIGKVVEGLTTGDTGKLLAYNTTRKTLWVRCDAADDLFDDIAETITVDTIASVAVQINVVATAGTFTRVSGDFTTDGFVVGQTIVTSGFANAGNNTTKIISTVTATVITVTVVTGLVDETGSGDEKVTGKVAAGAMSAASTTGENLYVNVYTLGTLTSASDTIYVIQADEKVTSWWAAGIDAFDVLVKVKELGATIDSGNIIVYCRYYPTAGNAALYDHFPITLTAGRQAVPLATALDLNNTSSVATAQGWANAMVFAYAGPYSRTLGGVTKNYDVEIDLNTDTVAHLYEAIKCICREGSTTQVDGDNGEEYIKAEATYAAVKASPLGTFAGGKFFGARGVWITDYAAADAQSFQLISSDNTTVNPPNTVVCKVVAVVAADSVAMFMLATDGGLIAKDTYTLSGQHLSTATTVVVTAAITGNWSGQDPPAAGYLRVVNPTTGAEVLKKYTSWTGSTFTLDGTLGTQCENTWKVYVPIIDEAATSTSIQNSIVKAAASTVYIRTVVRHYATPPAAIVPWSQDTTLPLTGVTVNATRTADGIVT